jgi:uncharacterized protein
MKMKKNLFIAVLLILFLPAFLFAQRVVDNAGLLSTTEKADLERQLAEIASTYNFDLVIVTETDIGNVYPGSFAGDFFDRGGYGLGNDRDGCLFLQVTGSSDYWFSTSGRGIKILNSTANGKLESDVLRFLRNDDPAGAYRAFINAWEKFLVLDAKGGRSYNFFHQWNAVLVIIAWVVSFLIGLFVVQAWKAQMNTALPQKQADLYVVSGSLAFTSKQERFLYSSVSKTKRQTESSSSLPAMSLTSSSGRTHGGSGGKYKR